MTQIDTTNPARKTWYNMTPEEKGALLLAHHEGRVIECWFGTHGWCSQVPNWYPVFAYRVRPEPKRETVTLYCGDKAEPCFWHTRWSAFDTHRLTFDLVDGEPDCASIKMEKM